MFFHVNQKNLSSLIEIQPQTRTLTQYRPFPAFIANVPPQSIQIKNKKNFLQLAISQAKIENIDNWTVKCNVPHPNSLYFEDIFGGFNPLKFLNHCITHQGKSLLKLWCAFPLTCPHQIQSCPL